MKLKEEIQNYVKENIGSFHSKKLNSLKKLELETILRRKNPYLYRAKNIETFRELVKSILDAHLSSQEETLFGEFLEGLAIFVCSKVYNGHKSSAEGIDLEFEKDNIVYIVSIKSGPNWGNSSQIKKLQDQFKKAKIIRQTNTSKRTIVAVNGCCYGYEKNPEKGDYIKYCGQQFWEFISGDANLYKEILEPLGYLAQEKNKDFNLAYEEILNKFSEELHKDFSSKTGSIDWGKIVFHYSSMHK